MTQFIDDHAQEIQEAQAYQAKGRADAAIREECADKIMDIYSRLIEGAPVGDGEAEE